MQKIKPYLGYSMAVISIFIVLATFLGQQFFAEEFAAITGLKISPWYTGGEVTKTISHGSYETMIHTPVFMALIGERKKGFVQIDWAPLSSLPGSIDEEIDCTGDGVTDFRIVMDTQTHKGTLEKHTECVIALQGVYKMKDRIAVRVSLENPGKSCSSCGKCPLR